MFLCLGNGCIKRCTQVREHPHSKQTHSDMHPDSMCCFLCLESTYSTDVFLLLKRDEHNYIPLWFVCTEPSEQPEQNYLRQIILFFFFLSFGSQIRRWEGEQTYLVSNTSEWDKQLFFFLTRKMIAGKDAPSNTASTYSGSTPEFTLFSSGRFSVDCRNNKGYCCWRGSFTNWFCLLSQKSFFVFILKEVVQL